MILDYIQKERDKRLIREKVEMYYSTELMTNELMKRISCDLKKEYPQYDFKISFDYNTRAVDLEILE